MLNSIVQRTGRSAGLLFFFCFLLAASVVQAQEICNNGVDDDNDGYIDCYDADCAGNATCDTAFFFGGPTPSCQFSPSPSNFLMGEQWRTNVSTHPMDNRQTPVIGDIDGDGVPEVVGRQVSLANALYIFNGATGAHEVTINSPPTDAFLDAVAIADIDNDGFGEIVIIADGGSGRQMICYEHTGTQKWISSFGVGFSVDDDRWTPGIADFDEDGNPEIYAGNQVYSGVTGALRASAGPSASRGASPVSPNEAFSVAADVLPDPACADCQGLELVCGNTVFSVNLGTGVITPRTQIAGQGDGPTSLADLDLDGDLDAVVVSSVAGSGRVFAWDLQTNAQIGTTFQIDNATGAGANLTSAGGHPNIADFNGDGTLEIGLAGRHVYVVLDYNAGTNQLQELWSRPTNDNSERTGSSVFDFEGDGANEVVYRDQDTLYVLDGVNGNSKAAVPCPALTRYDYPVVADVDGNGETNIVCSCDEYIISYEPSSVPWVRARPVMNQHSYFVVNVNDDLTIPRELQDHSDLFPSNAPANRTLNAFLTQSTYLASSGLPTFAAADDSISLVNPITDMDYTFCTDGVNDLIGVAPTIFSVGTNPIPANTQVSFYNGSPFTPGGFFIDTTIITVAIPAGSSVQLPMKYLPDQGGTFELFMLVNDDGSIPPPLPGPTTSHNECDYTNNLDSISIFGCGNTAPVVDTFGIPTDTLWASTPEDQQVVICVSATDNQNDEHDVTAAVTLPMMGSVGGFGDADSCFTYTPNPSVSGQDTFVIVVCDNASFPLCDTTVIIVNIIPQNDPPIGVDDMATTPEEVPVTIAVLDNDSDPEGDPMNISIVMQPPNGMATVSGDSIIYTPNVDYFGPDTICYAVCDNGVPSLCDTAYVYIDVTPVNDAPIAVKDTLFTTAGVPIGVRPTLNDLSSDGPIFFVTILQGPSNGTFTQGGDSVTYTPDPNFLGSDTMTYMICDTVIPPLCDTGCIVINVLTQNNAPMAVDDFTSTTHGDSVTIAVQYNDSDPDGDGLTTFMIGCPPSNGTATISGANVVYTPNVGFLGNDTLCYILCDQPLAGPPFCDTAFVYITVTNDNNPPNAMDDFATTMHADSVVIPAQANDSDPDGNGTAITAIPCPPMNGSAYISGTGIVYTPNVGFVGIDTLCYLLCDIPPAGPPICDTGFVYITVTTTNQPPNAVDDAIMIAFGTSGTVDVLTNDSDPDSTDSLSAPTIITPPSNGSLLDNGNGSYTYTPATGYSGQDSFQYVICDNGVPPLCDSAWVYIDVGENPLMAVEIPDGFSPNGDDTNDNFFIGNIEQYPGNSLVIFNRWGSTVFEMGDYDNSWDGTWKGNVVPDGTYFYVLDLADGSEPRSGYIVIYR
ncbi:MAG: Ig-like domain-containing protein [Bacteroidota bacterium]